MDHWIAAVKKAGIRQIQGAVIGDARIFDEEGTALKWVKEDLGSYYGAGSYGLSVFDNLYKLYFQTGAVGTVPRMLRSEPDVSFIDFINRLQTAAVSSDSAYILGFPFSPERTLQGVLPANRDQYVLKGDLPDPSLFLATYLTRQLQQAGITIAEQPTTCRLLLQQGMQPDEERKELTTTY